MGHVSLPLFLICKIVLSAYIGLNQKYGASSGMLGTRLALSCTRHRYTCTIHTYFISPSCKMERHWEWHFSDLMFVIFTTQAVSLNLISYAKNYVLNFNCYIYLSEFFRLKILPFIVLYVKAAQLTWPNLYNYLNEVYVLCAKFRSGQYRECPAQTSDPNFVQPVHGLSMCLPMQH